MTFTSFNPNLENGYPFNCNLYAVTGLLCFVQQTVWMMRLWRTVTLHASTAPLGGGDGSYGKDGAGMSRTESIIFVAGMY